MTTKKTPAKTTAKSSEASHAASSPKPARDAGVHPAPEAPKGSSTTRYVMIAVLAVVAFLGAYRFASAGNQQGISGGVTQAVGGLLPAAGAAGSAGGGCCGSGGGAPIEGAATEAGGVQKIAIDMSSGSYNPNVITLKAGVPTEITFGQSSGCTAQVQSSDLGFSEDLTSGPKTVKIGALEPGTYNFACGMNMVTGQIVVQ